MTEPARVTRIPSNVYSVDIPKMQPLKTFLVDGNDLTDYVENLSFTSRNLKLHQFGKQMYVEHASYYEMSYDYIEKDYNDFYKGLVDNCKDLFIQSPAFNVTYDAMRHQDIVSWKVYAGSDQIDFFKNLFIGPPEIVEVEKRVYIPTYPNTLRECFKRAWVIIKGRFSRER